MQATGERERQLARGISALEGLLQQLECVRGLDNDWQRCHRIQQHPSAAAADHKAFQRQRRPLGRRDSSRGKNVEGAQGQAGNEDEDLGGPQLSARIAAGQT